MFEGGTGFNQVRTFKSIKLCTTALDLYATIAGMKRI